MKRGVALVVAISTIFILLLVGILLVLLARKEIWTTTALKKRKEAFAQSETGINRAIAFFENVGVMSPALIDSDFSSEENPLFREKEGFNTNIKWSGVHRPIPGFQVGPRFQGGARFEAFYFYIESVGYQGKLKKKIYLTLERIFSIEQ
ncbi:TPA: hypothetical protein DCX16_06330 [bacterium]|nr:hypothetical protein [bacterium]